MKDEGEIIMLFFSASVLRYHRNSWNVKKYQSKTQSDTMLKKVLFIPR